MEGNQRWRRALRRAILSSGVPVSVAACRASFNERWCRPCLLLCGDYHTQF